MFIPLNLEKRQDLGLSVIRSNKGYSVAIMSIANSFGMDELPSYMHNVHNDKNLMDACACMTDYQIVEGANLYDCIEKCLKQLDA